MLQLINNEIPKMERLIFLRTTLEGVERGGNHKWMCIVNTYAKTET